MKTTLYSIILVLCIGIFSIASADSLDDAISWMHEKGLTIFETKADFEADRGLRRDEAAKFYLKFAQLLGKNTYVKTESECSFSDLDQAWPDLQETIKKACMLGLFQGSQGKFSPQEPLTNAQAVAVLMRLLQGYEAENGPFHRADGYYTEATKQGIVVRNMRNNKDTPASRGDVAKIIWKGNSRIDTMIRLTTTEAVSKSPIVRHNNTEPVSIGLKSYYNTGVGFGLKFPSTWSDFKEHPDQGGIDFSLDGRQMFYIDTQPIEEYNKYGGPISALFRKTYLGKNDTHIFWFHFFPIGYSTTDNPSSEMKKRIAEIESILKTFYIGNFSFIPFNKTKKIYDLNENLIQEIVYSSFEGGDYNGIGDTLNIFYDSQNNKIEEIKYEGTSAKIIERTYNTKNQKTQKIFFKNYSTSSSWDPVEKIERSYDFSGNQIEEHIFSRIGFSWVDSISSSKNSWIYDSKGNKIEQFKYIYDDKIGKRLAKTKVNERSYDSSGNQVGEIIFGYSYNNGHVNSNTGWKYERSYDSKGNKNQEIRYNRSGSRRIPGLDKKRFYDSKGNVVQEDQGYRGAGSSKTLLYRTDRTYDENNNKIGKISYTFGEGTLISSSKYERFYDSKGNVVQEIYHWINGPISTSSHKKERSYNSKRNVIEEINYQRLTNIRKPESVDISTQYQ